MTQDTQKIVKNINPNEHTRISSGSAVALHFKVSLENGMVIDSTFERDKPVTLVMGDGNLLAGFEKVLLGLRTGDKRTASLSPAEAFGEWNAENVQSFDKNQFALSVAGEPQVGQMIEFADKGNNTLAGVVQQIGKDSVQVDFNHPLAGKTVLFTVEIFSVTPANASPVRFS